MTTLYNFKDILLVSIGAIFGANIRFIIYQKLKEINMNVYLIILLINTFSSFLLGLFVSILPEIIYLNLSSQFVLFFVIGFLGSLSTFSTFVYDLFDSALKFNFPRVLKSFVLSIPLGIIAIALGTLIAY